MEQWASGIEDAGYERVSVPSLALYAPLPPVAGHHSLFDLLPPASQRLFEERYGSLATAQAADMAHYTRTLPFGRMERLLRASHYVFLTQPEDTYARIMSFLQRFLPPPR